MTILERLEEGRVFSIERWPPNLFRLQEQCDAWFSEDLTADELRALASELNALADEVQT